MERRVEFRRYVKLTNTCQICHRPVEMTVMAVFGPVLASSKVVECRECRSTKTGWKVSRSAAVVA